MSYGYCPRCGSRGKLRERRPDGNDVCEAGHVYPSREATGRPRADALEAMRAEVADLRRRLDESERVAAAYRRQARSSILTNWQHEHIEAGRAQCNAAADRVLDQIRDEAIAGGDPLCPECRRRPVGTSQGLCSRCDEAQGSGPRPE